MATTSIGPQLILVYLAWPTSPPQRNMNDAPQVYLTAQVQTPEGCYTLNTPCCTEGGNKSPRLRKITCRFN